MVEKLRSEKVFLLAGINNYSLILWELSDMNCTIHGQKILHVKELSNVENEKRIDERRRSF